MEKEKHLMLVLRRCTHCDKTKAINVYKEDMDRYADGELIQNVWPDKSPEWREELKTGFCPKCWDDLFGGE